MVLGGSGGLGCRITLRKEAEVVAKSASVEASPVLKSLRLLTHLARSRDPLALADLSRALTLPKATAYRLAHKLEDLGFVRKNPLTLRYSVGPTFEDVALSALRSGGGTNRRRVLMDDLSERLGVRTNFAVLKAGKLTLVEWVESSSPVRIDLKADIQVPAHCSASGKLLMAFGPDYLRERFLDAAPFRALTKSTITSAEALKRELATIRRRGYAEDNQEFLVGICCLAVPVRNSSGEVVAGLGVMAPSHDFPLTKARQSLGLIQACAEAISAESGWGASPPEMTWGGHRASAPPISRLKSPNEKRGEAEPTAAKPAHRRGPSA